MTEVIGDLIVKAIAAGELPDETPGVKLTRHGSGLEIDISGESIRIPYEQAELFFYSLARLAKGAGTWKNGGQNRSLELRRAGPGLILEIKHNGTSVARFSMTLSIAFDLRRQLWAAYPEDYNQFGRYNYLSR